MSEVARIPAGAIFFVLLLSTLLMRVDWKFSAIAWVVLFVWYVSLRATLSESQSYLRSPMYLVSAGISFSYPPALALIGIAIGDATVKSLFAEYENLIAPIHTVAVLFMFYSAWTAARELVKAEAKTAADRAVRWERTWLPFVQLLFWPIGIWFVQKRVQAVID